MPLIRYNGVTFKFYATENFDYVVNIDRCYPLKASDLLYMSTQPSIQMLQRKAILVPCKKNSGYKRQYKKVRVRPPTQFKTSWMFQQDLANFPLVLLTASVASFDRYYLSSTAKSSTMGFVSLNTKTFVLHDWQEPPTSGYHPQEKIWFWGTDNGAAQLENTKLKDLIYLGGTGPYKKGTPINYPVTTNYTSSPQLWGNIFHPDYLTGTSGVFWSNMPPTELITKITNSTVTVGQTTGITPRTLPQTVECRYNPFADKGKGNAIYLVSNHSDHTAWKPIEKPELQRNDLPLWLLVWGWLDWQKKLAQTSQPDINYMTVIKSNYISSNPTLDYYVVLDDNFLTGESPYREGLSASDEKHFYPKNTFQIKTLNEIGSVGPGVVKLQKDQSCEAHFKYNFHFKLGGCPAKMETICNPSDQPKYPIPSTEQNTTSLQSPTTALQTYLYDFDERKGLLTKPAAKRIKKDYGTETTLLPFTGAATDLPPPKEISTENETSSEEEETSQQELLRLRRKQKQLKQRILQLLDIQNLE